MHFFQKKKALKKPSKYILLCIRPIIIRFMHFIPKCVQNIFEVAG